MVIIDSACDNVRSVLRIIVVPDIIKHVDVLLVLLFHELQNYRILIQRSVDHGTKFFLLLVPKRLCKLLSNVWIVHLIVLMEIGRLRMVWIVVQMLHE